MSSTLLLMRGSGPLMQEWRHGSCNDISRGTRLSSGLGGGILTLFPCWQGAQMAGSFQAAAAQVYLRETVLKFDTEHVDVLHYEPALQLLLAVRRQSITISSVLSGSQPPQVCLHMRHRHIVAAPCDVCCLWEVTICSFFAFDMSSKGCVAALALTNLRAS